MFNIPKNCTYSLQCVFACSVWKSEQTAIISLYSINWVAFISEAECVYCAVGTETLQTVELTLFFKGLNEVMLSKQWCHACRELFLLVSCFCMRLQECSSCEDTVLSMLVWRSPVLRATRHVPRRRVNPLFCVINAADSAVSFRSYLSRSDAIHNSPSPPFFLKFLVCKIAYTCFFKATYSAPCFSLQKPRAHDSSLQTCCNQCLVYVPYATLHESVVFVEIRCETVGDGIKV
jgi:hypothetical protein